MTKFEEKTYLKYLEEFVDVYINSPILDQYANSTFGFIFDF